jgi:hypothetical protein
MEGCASVWINGSVWAAWMEATIDEKRIQKRKRQTKQSKRDEGRPKKKGKGKRKR